MTSNHNAFSFTEYRRHNPYGRYTGRGSGIHRVTKATEHI